MKCGYVAILGVPNAGKSTLVNRIVGTKVSIVSPKVQTTRNRVLGIAIEDQTQMILVDTPGIFDPKRRLEKAMVKAAWGASGDADIISLLVDVSKKDLGESFKILDLLLKQNHKPLLILNKIDKIEKAELLRIIDELTKDRDIEKIFMISALKGDGVTDFVTYLKDTLPEHPWLFPEDQITDAPLRMLAAEITREKLFYSLKQELPYSLMVETEKWEEFDNGSVKISQSITVMRDGQKAIVLGKGGSHIKMIGEQSRKDLEKLLDRKVHLMLHVKVRSQWTEKKEFYEDFGLDFES